MNIFELFGVIAINDNPAMRALDKVGKAAVSCGKVVAKGLAAASAAGAAMGTALTKLSIENYAAYEQLKGGVETLFGAGGKSLEEYAESVGKSVEEASGEYEKLMASQDKVFKNANKAYKTAGLSANAYMETVTSFSASLLQGLGGDTAAAAEMSDMAITDMADNANKMGTNIGMIQNAYQGFAKQNYTMLDNLKLGFGGTQAEMARLINDSGVLGDSMTVTAETVNKVSFAKIIEAIHVIQTQMGITGTTAKEASETISGSFSTFKATWTNLLTGLADDGNIEPLIDTFFEAGQTVLRNVGKVIPKIKDNVVAAVRHIGVKVRQGMSQTVWPAIQKFAKVQFGIELPEWSAIETQVTTWWAGVKSGVQTVCTWTLNLFENPKETADEITAALSTWWTGTALPAVKSVSKWALNLFDVPIEDDATITEHIATWWQTAGKRVIDACSWTLQLFGMPKEDAAAISSEVKKWWAGVSDLVEIACNWLLNFNGVKPWGEEETKKVRDWWDGACTTAESVIKWFLNPPSMPDPTATVRTIENWWAGVKSRLKLWFGITPEIESQVNYHQTQVEGAAESAGEAVEEATGSALAGELAEQVVTNSTNNPDSNVDWGAALSWIWKPHAHGLRNVPHDNYPAMLHYGETVLPQHEADDYRSSRGKAEDVATLANRLESAISSLAGILQEIAGNTAAGTTITMDGRVVAGQIAPHIDAALGTLTNRKGRRN